MVRISLHSSNHFKPERRALTCSLAVKPDEAAQALRDWVSTFDMSKSGQFWSVRGTAGVRSAEHVLGKKEESVAPLQLRW